MKVPLAQLDWSIAKLFHVMTAVPTTTAVVLTVLLKFMVGIEKLPGIDAGVHVPPLLLDQVDERLTVPTVAGHPAVHVAVTLNETVPPGANAVALGPANVSAPVRANVTVAVFAAAGAVVVPVPVAA